MRSRMKKGGSSKRSSSVASSNVKCVQTRMVRRLLIASMKFHRNTHKPLLGPLASRCSLRMSSSCSRSWYTPSAKLDSRGKDLIVQANGEDSSYHSTWLRHNCQCPSCLAPSGQKTIDLSEITPSITLESVALLGL